MANYFHVFGKRRCKFCAQATKLLEQKELSYVLAYCDKAPQALDELKDNCQWKTIPIIFEVVGQSENFIGGYTELEEYLSGTRKEEGRGEGTDNISGD